MTETKLNMQQIMATLHLGKCGHNFYNMRIKHLTCIAASFLVMIMTCSCDRTLRDTSKGNLTVSFRVNGDMFKCEYVNDNNESPMRVAYYNDTFLDIRAKSFMEKDVVREGVLMLTISDTEPIETGRKYPLKYYTGQSEDRVAEPPVYFGGFNEYRSVDGWIKLRKIKNYKDKNGYLVISGNFEFTARNEDGETIEITGGTFDGLY